MQAQDGWIVRIRPHCASLNVAQWRALGTCFIQVVPDVQIRTPQDNFTGVIRLGDSQNRLKTWFAAQNASLVVVRPDRFVAALAIPQTLNTTLDQLAQAMALTPAASGLAEEKVA